MLIYLGETCNFGISAKQIMAVDSTTAQATFELANNVRTVASADAIFRYDHKKQQEILSVKPWEKE